MGEKHFLPFHCYFVKNLSNTPLFPQISFSIVGGTRDYSTNGFGQRSNLLILQLFHGLKLIFIGKFYCFDSIWGW